MAVALAVGVVQLILYMLISKYSFYPSYVRQHCRPFLVIIFGSVPVLDNLIPFRLMSLIYASLYKFLKLQNVFL